MLVLLAGYFGDPTDPRLIPGSVAIELTHLATLYHDDVIDEADRATASPSANARWDNTVAILTGDYLFARASEISADLGPEICRLLARTIAVLCDGQIREVAASGKVDQTEEAYLEIIRRKTGVLIATSCRLGGMLSDAPEEHVETLEAFGESLGMAFQLSDDIMDFTATQLELGKEPGTDMREGVYTLPVLHALRRGRRPGRAAADPCPRRARRRAARPGPRARRDGGSIDHARGRPAEVRARDRPRPAPPGRARAHALVQLARFLAVRCGAEVRA